MLLSRLCRWTIGVSVISLAICQATAIPTYSEERKCQATDSCLSLPNGFCATVFADKVGHARQLVVTPDNTVYVNTWSGVYYGNDKPHEGGFLIALKDTKGTGQADVNMRFGPTFAEGAARRHRYLALQGLALCRDRRQDRPLQAQGWSGGARGQARDDLEWNAP